MSLVIPTKHPVRWQAVMDCMNLDLYELESRWLAHPTGRAVVQEYHDRFPVQFSERQTTAGFNEYK